MAEPTLIEQIDYLIDDVVADAASRGAEGRNTDSLQSTKTLHDAIAAALERHSLPGGAAGYRLVPEEPTEAMVEVGLSAFRAQVGYGFRADKIYRAMLAASLPPSVWMAIDTAPKNTKVLVAYRNPPGNWRIVTACYHTQLPWSDDYVDQAESEYAPEGWYEESDSNETIWPTSSPPTHWAPLPSPPQQEGK